MSLQVNLLSKTERRYQGIVSMKVMILGSVGVLMGVAVLVLSLAGISKMTLNANMERARSEWESLEHPAAVVLSLAEDAEANRLVMVNLQKQLQGEDKAMYAVLRAVQTVMPAKMVLNELHVGLDEALEDTRLYYTLRMSGQAQGELTAVDAKRMLNADSTVRSFCGEVKLVSSQRASGDVWAFVLEGRRPAASEGAQK